MVAYWTRVVSAWLLLHFASRVMNDAEKLLVKNHETREPPTEEQVVSEVEE